MHSHVPTEPVVEMVGGIAVWRDGENNIALKAKQYEAFEALKAAGETNQTVSERRGGYGEKHAH